MTTTITLTHNEANELLNKLDIAVKNNLDVIQIVIKGKELYVNNIAHDSLLEPVNNKDGH